MTDGPDDRYLWDRTGAPDPEVARLEALLAPLAHRAAPPLPPAAAAGTRRGAWIPFATAAAVLVAAAVATISGVGQGGTPSHAPSAAPESPALAIAADGASVATGTWVEALGTARELEIGDVGHVTVDPGSRLRVAHAREDATTLFLERGRIEARISARARPRFFTVDTPAVRCVDLGCRYTLSVDGARVSHVRVLTGQVSFETGTREVFVPAGASCTARPGAEPGTPRFDDAATPLAAALDAFDAKPAGDPGRPEAARGALALVAQDRDTLPVWHWLTDPDATVATAALDVLVHRFGARPVGRARPGAPEPRTARPGENTSGRGGDRPDASRGPRGRRPARDGQIDAPSTERLLSSTRPARQRTGRTERK